MIPAPAPPPEDAVHWCLDSLYPSVDSPAFKRDLLAAHARIKALRELTPALRAAARFLETGAAREDLARLFAEGDRLRHEAEEPLADLRVYCMALASGGEGGGAVSTISRRVSALIAELGMATRDMLGSVSDLRDADFESLIAPLSTPGGDCHWRRAWAERRDAASVAEERVIAMLGGEAYKAWSDLYQNLAGELVVRVPSRDGVAEPLGVAQAIELIVDADPERRRSAWFAIREAWAPHETTVATILNSLASYRLKLPRIRNRSGEREFLTLSLAENRLSAEALDAMIAALERDRPRLWRAVSCMARLVGKERLDPWDLAASVVDPAIDAGAAPLAAALDFLAESFAEVDPAMGDFVMLARRSGWIDARPPAKERRLGDFQTSVRRGRHPLVFVNYRGHRIDVITLAHELGHAYQYWVLRDEPPIHHHLPPSLAECVSTFAEMLARERWLASAPDDPLERRHHAWVECQTAVAYLVNMPASFTFEHRLHLERRQGALSAADLRRMLGESWAHWFGATLTSHDDRGWARKPHFASTRIFYNYPYSLGYLVANLLGDARGARGAAFPDFFRAFLRDCAYLDVDAVLRRHFAVPGERPDFWAAALDLVDRRIARAEQLASSQNLPESARQGQGSAGSGVV